jgi:UDP-N-acetylglucosamine--N-acetylmuramyl-(pentapeptide) pyrophosphoryl-undecaprenol N-acetylglucosamine transferase
MLPLIRELSDRFFVYTTSWGEGMQFLRRNGVTCVEVPPVDVQWGSEGRMAFKKTVRNLPKFYGSFGLQILRETEIMSSMQPSLVISDSRLSAVIAANLQSVRCVLVTNQIRVNLPPLRSKMMRFLERVNGESLAAFWNAADVTVVPDLPPPFTISEDSLETLRLPRNRYWYVGFFNGHFKDGTVVMTDGSTTSEKSSGVRKKVFFMISGPSASRLSLLPKVERAAKLLSTDYEVVVSKGNPAGGSEPERVDGMTVFEWCPDEEVKKQIAASDLIVSRAGHETISKVILAGKPALLIPIPFHGEQWGNAKKCERLGFAKALDQYSLTSEQLANQIRLNIEDKSLFKKAFEMKQLAWSMDGLENTVKVVTWLYNDGFVNSD